MKFPLVFQRDMKGRFAYFKNFCTGLKQAPLSSSIFLFGLVYMYNQLILVNDLASLQK